MAGGTIGAVLEDLDAIIAWSVREKSREGYFAALYRRVTAEVQDSLGTGRFEDDARMERLDVVFARRYIVAHERRRRGSPTSRCWQLAFDWAGRWRPIVLQHLLLGMNAHIHLDLGIAAAETAPGSALPALRRDFDEINDILVGMLDAMQDAVARVSPWMGVLDRIGCRTDEALCGFGIRAARRRAWDAAAELAPLPPEARGPAIARQDLLATALGAAIIRPRALLGGPLLAVRLREPREPEPVIRALLAR